MICTDCKKKYDPSVSRSGNKRCNACKKKQIKERRKKEIIKRYGSIENFRYCKKCRNFKHKSDFTIDQKTGNYFSSCTRCLLRYRKSKLQPNNSFDHKNLVSRRNPHGTIYVHNLCKKIDSMTLEEMNRSPCPELDK